MAYELKISNGISTLRTELETKAHCYRLFMSEHLYGDNKLFEDVLADVLTEAFHELILTNSTKIRVPRHEGADLSNEWERIVYRVEIIDLSEATAWTHDFSFNFSFSGMPEDWTDELAAADFRYKIQETLHNMDGQELMERVECYNSFKEGN